MRIAVDLRALQLGSEYRGIGAYLVQLLRRFPISDGPDRFVFLRFDESDPVAALGLADGGYDEIIVDRGRPVTGKVSAMRRLWDEAFHSDFGSLVDGDVDVFWQPDMYQGVPDFTETRVVVTMYDLIPMIMQAEYLPSRPQRLRRDGRDVKTWIRAFLSGEVADRKYRRCVSQVSRADTVLSISEATTDDLVRLLDIPRRRVVTIPLGAPQPLEEPDDDHGSGRDGRPFLLFIGGVDHRRRVADLVGAFEVLRDEGRPLDLVLVGRDFESMNEVHHQKGLRALRETRYPDDIDVLGYVDDDEKDDLYRRASAFVFPSAYEGFGLPVLEAMAHRCPVVAYDNSSIPEVAGDAAVLVADPGPGPLADAIGALLDDPERRSELVAAGIDRVRLFSWDRCAQRTLDELRA